MRYIVNTIGMAEKLMRAENGGGGGGGGGMDEKQVIDLEWPYLPTSKSCDHMVP